MKTVVIGVSSGIAAYKSIELITLLRNEGVEIDVVMTESATKMVSPQHFEKASGNPVFSELFEKTFDYTKILQTRHVDHIDLADKADVVVLAPATANLIAKISCGIADDFLTTMLLATQAPVIVCPSMNVHMWANSVVRENVQKLKQRGYQIIEPEEGALACGYEGQGRLASIEGIKREIMLHLVKQDTLKGKKVIVTAGATEEKIDDVRFITNKSSGKMGVALAEACYKRGAEVLLLRAKSAVRPMRALQEETFVTGEDLQQLLKRFVPEYNILFHTAAVGDFSVKESMNGKLSSEEEKTITLKKNAKIVDMVKVWNKAIKLIAFKAEYDVSEKALRDIASKRLHETKADAIIANDVKGKDRGFESDTNEVIILTANGKDKKIPLCSKQEIAEESLDFLLEQTCL